MGMIGPIRSRFQTEPGLWTLAGGSGLSPIQRGQDTMRTQRGVWVGLLLVALCLAGGAHAQSTGKADKELIAVMDLQAVQASAAEAQALGDRLREVMLKTGRFKLVERSQLDAVLNEQALQQAGCTSQECAVQVGRILGVRKLVVGKVVKVSNDVWLLSAVLLDAETAETLRAESVRHKGDFFALMDQRVQEIGERMAAPAESPPVVVSAEREAASASASPAAGFKAYRVAVLPGWFTGQYASANSNGRRNTDWILKAIRDGVVRDNRLDVTFSYYEGFGVPASTHRVSEDRTWKGLLFKEVDRDYVRAWARDLKVDAALAVSVSIPGGGGPVDAYLYDALRDRWYQHSARWEPGKLTQGIRGAVDTVLTEFRERNP